MAMVSLSAFLKQRHHHHPSRLLLQVLDVEPFFFKSYFTSLSSSSSSSSSSSFSAIGEEYSQGSLTEDELARFNLLIPRLCFTNQLPTAIRLTSAALLLPDPPPLRSLSLSLLIYSLSSQPDLALSASLLTRLQRSPTHLTSVTSLLIASYLKNRRPRDALQVFDEWLMRPASPCLPHPASFATLLGAFCRNGMVFEALKVLGAMLAADIVPGSDLRRCLFRSLLRNARIMEAVKLDEALNRAASDRTGGSTRMAAMRLDRVFREWTE